MQNMSFDEAMRVKRAFRKFMVVYIKLIIRQSPRKLVPGQWKVLEDDYWIPKFIERNLTYVNEDIVRGQQPIHQVPVE